jgi:energy-coupling factor transporter transmembrane protein EcfT
MALKLLIAEGKRGPASHLDPSCRLACLALFSMSSILGSLPFVACLAFGFLILLIFSGLSLLKIMRETLFIFIFTGITAALRIWGSTLGSIDRGAVIYDSLIYFLRLLSAFLAGRLFYASTTSSELRDAATRIMRKIPLLRRLDLGMYIALVLGYIPLIFEEWQDSREAARSRGMSRKPDLRQESRFMTAFMRRLMLKAVELPQALKARGWSRSRGIAPLQWGLPDTILLIIAISSTTAAILRLV